MASPSAVAMASPSAVALKDQTSLSAVALKDQGDEQFKEGNYLKAAALYTQAIKLDPDNATLYSNRAAAFLQLAELSKALVDAEKTINLKPDWEKAIAAFDSLAAQSANGLVSRKIKRLSLLAREKKALDVENMHSNVGISKNSESLKTAELLADLKSRGEEDFANGNCFEMLFGLDLPPSREEIAMVASGGIGGFCGYRHHGGGRGGLLDLLGGTFNYSAKGGGGLLDILDEGVNHMVAPTKLCTWFFQAPFHSGGRDQGEKRALMSGPCDVTTPDCSILAKKAIRQRPRPRLYPIRRPDVIIQPKPMAKIYELFRAIQRAVQRFFAFLNAQLPVALLLGFGFVAAVASTFYTWNNRVPTVVAIHGVPGNKIVVTADDMFGCPSARSELVNLCNSRTCMVVVPISVIHHWERRHVGIDSLKIAPALLLIKNLKKAGKVRLFQDPMHPNYKENFMMIVRILDLLYPGAAVSIATNNRLLKF